MKPQKLEFYGLFNFLAEQTVDFSAFPEPGCFYIFGEHDGGRETLPDILTLALFGKTEELRPERYIINRKGKDAATKFAFEHAGCDYYVERTFCIAHGQKRVETRVALFAADGMQNSLIADGESADAKIEEILGLNALNYRKAVSLNIYHAVNLLSLSDDAQLRYFKNMLGITAFDSRLKKNLTERVSALNVKKAGADRKPVLSEEERQKLISEYAAKRDGESIRLNELADKRIGLEAQMQRALEVLELKEKLKKINEEIEGLEAESAEYERLENELKTALEVNRILPAVRKKEELLGEVEEFKIRREELIPKIAEADAELEALAIELETADAEYFALYEEYSAKKNAFKNNLEEKAKTDKGIRAGIEESVKKDKEELEKIVENRGELAKRLDALNEEIAEIKRKMNSLTIDPELNMDMSRAHSVEASLKRLLKEKAYLDNKAAELDVKIDDATRRRELYNARVVALQEEIAVLEAEKNKLIGQGDTYALFTAEYRKYQNLAHQVGKVDTYNDNLKLLAKKKQINLEEIDFDTLELDRAEATRMNAEKNLYNVNNKIEVASREREKVANVNYYVGVSNSIRVGEFCPVCTNVLTVKQHKAFLPIIPVDMELNKLRDDRTRAEEILSNTVAVIAGLNANILHMKRLNQDLERDEAFYVDCINDILRESGYPSVQLLYEAFLKQKEKYDNLRIVYDRAEELIVSLDRLKDELRDAKVLADVADGEVSVYSEQYNERKYALAAVEIDYKNELERYAFLNSLSEYETPEKILEKLEEMASEKLVFEREYHKKTEERSALERLISDCDKLELAVLGKTRPLGENGDTMYSDIVMDAVTDRYYKEIRELLDAEERVDKKSAEIEEKKAKADALERLKISGESELNGIDAVIGSGERMIESLDREYIERADVQYSDSEELSGLAMGHFLYEDKLLKFNGYKVKYAALLDERNTLAPLVADDTPSDDGADINIAAIDREMKALAKSIAISEHEIERISAENVADNGDSTALSDEEYESLVAELNVAEGLKKLVDGGAYADYTASLNAAAILSAADLDVYELTGGRYGLAYADGIRVKDKFFGDKYRTLNTLDETERIIVGACIMASLCRAMGGGVSDIIFIDGFDFFMPKHADVLKRIARKLNDSFIYAGATLRESFENAGYALSIATQENGTSVINGTGNANG